MEGFINIHRCLLDSQVFASEKKLKVWIWLLLKACYKERFVNLKIGKGESTLKLNRGELLFGRFKAEEQLGLDGSTIYRIIKWFENENMVEVKTNNQYTIITICKYDSYQSLNLENEQPTNSQRTTNEQDMNQIRTRHEPDMNTYKKANKSNKDKKDNNKEAIASITKSENFILFENWLKENAPQVLKMKEPFTDSQFQNIAESLRSEKGVSILKNMHNTDCLLKKYRSANLTFQNWYKRVETK